MARFGLFLCLIFSLVSLQQTAAFSHKTDLHHETHRTLRTLQSLPSHCKRDLETIIVSEQNKLPTKLLYCSISSIVIDLTEVIVDTGFFGFEAYEELPALWNDLKDLRNCVKEATVKAMVTCALEFAPGTVQAVEVIVGGLENYVGEMEMIIPLLVDEIKQCQKSGEQEYLELLELVVRKATECAQ